MIGKVIILLLEAFVGFILMLAALYNGKDSAIGAAIGIEISVRSTVMVAGGFYVLKGLIQLVLEMAEPSAITLIKRFLLLFESASGFIMVISSYCDSRPTFIEDSIGTQLTVNHGLVILGVFYISRAFLQVVLERGDASVAEI